MKKKGKNMKKTTLFVTALAFLLVGCGSDLKTHTNTSNPSTSENPPPTSAVEKKEIAVVIGANYTDLVGSLSTIALDDAKTLIQGLVMTNGSDAVLRVFGGLIYVINRFGSDSIQVIDPNDNFKIIADYSVGAGSNPQDIVVFNDTAYVSRLSPQNDTEDQSDVLIIDPSTGEQLGGFNLQEYMTDDGEQLPFAAQMHRVGDYLYVACQDLSSWWVADTNGKVIVIDITTDTVTKSIELTGRNPADITYSPFSGKIYVTDTGVFDHATFTTDVNTDFGGIEVIDPKTNETEGILVDDADLGGNPSEIRIASEGIAYVITSSAILASFNPATYEVLNSAIYVSPGYYVPDFEIAGDGTILLTERNTTNSGIIVINDDGSIVDGPIGIGASPASVEIMEVEKK